MTPKRVAFLRIAQETNAFSPVETTLADFQRGHWRQGDDLMAGCAPGAPEVPGFIKAAELSGFVKGVRARAGQRITLVPLVSAWAVPGGPLAADAHAALRTQLEEAIREALPLDALYISLHGALCSRAHPDPEADFLAAARAVLGADAVLAASFDLHAQLTVAKLAPLDIATAYRTNPHRDHARVGQRTGDIVARTVLGEVKPRLAWRTLPMVLGGGTTIDFLPTMRPLYRWMRARERDPAVLYLSLFNCHMWNDRPDLGWSVVALVDDSVEGAAALAESLAEELADLCWSVRHAQPPLFPTAAESIEQARGAWLARRTGTVCMCDASDIVGAGAPGESTHLLRALLHDARDLKVLAPVRDAEVVQALWDAPLGTEVRCEVGGKLSPEQSPPLEVEGKLVHRGEPAGLGRALVLDLGHLQLVVTEGPPMAMQPGFYTAMGLSPWRADICVVKSLFPFRWYFRYINRKTIYARTEGVTDFQLVTRLRFDAPVWPTSPVEDWRPVDRQRRLAPPTPE